jgi:hypothetical protein
MNIMNPEINIKIELIATQSEILLEKALNGRPEPNITDFDAVLFCVSKLDKIKKLHYKDFQYHINTHAQIEIAPEIFFELIPQEDKDAKNAVTKTSYRLYSDELPLTAIKDYIATCRLEYESQKNNKLDGQICYFDQSIANDNKFSQALSFDKKTFSTTKTFNNVFFEQKAEVEGRVRHFLENKKWYDDRGISYTLGFIFSGLAGTGKSLAPGTRVMRYDGSLMAVENLEVGDLIMGDDDTPRRVGNVHHGQDTMYKITQSRGDDFVTNSVHILTLMLCQPTIESWSEKEASYRLHWFEEYELQTMVFPAARESEKPAAEAKMAAFKAGLRNTNLKGDIIDIELPDYLKKPAAWRRAFRGFKRTRVDWWADQFGDVSAYDAGFLNADAAAVYRCAGVDQRLQLLAGYFDAGATAKGAQYEYSAASRAQFDDVCFVARSLGFAVAECVPRRAGDTVSFVATVAGCGDELPLKRLKKAKKAKPARANCYAISVKKLASADYVGITVDGNGRFCLGDFTVTHNTSTIKAIANVTKRHIINVRLSQIQTNTQLKNLFYSPTLQIINPDTLAVERITVPIHQRLYTIEDVDCVGDLVKKREYRMNDLDDLDDDLVKPLKKDNIKKDKKPAVTENYDSDEELAAYYRDALVEEKTDMDKEQAAEDEKDRITLDSLLNIFDGTLEIPNRMICITTNHIEVLDSALIRPGRCDVQVTFVSCTKNIIKQMFDSFYGRDFPIAEFDKIIDYKVTPAVINQILFKHFSAHDNAIKEIVALSNKRQSAKSKGKART